MALGRKLEGRLHHVLGALRMKQAIHFFDTESVNMYIQQWERSFYQKLWIVFKKAGGDAYLEVAEYADLLSELKQIQGFRHCAPLTGAVVSKSLDWKDIRSYQTDA